MIKLLSTAAVAAAAFAATPAAAQNWTGPYVGAYVGINGVRDDVQDYWCNAACDAPTLNDVGLAGGLTAGYNHQIDENFVIGLEADLGTGNKAKSTTDYFMSWSDTTETYTFRDELKLNGSIRARAGLAMNSTMAFVTGGYAMAKAELEETTTFDNTNSGYTPWGAKFDGTVKGYVLGGGIEHIFNGRFTAKLEATHTVYGTKRACYMDLSGTDAGECWDSSDPVDDYVSWSPTKTSARIGFNYKF